MMKIWIDKNEIMKNDMKEELNEKDDENELEENMKLSDKKWDDDYGKMKW